MRVRLDLLTLVALASLAGAAPASGQCLERAVDSIAKDTCEVNQWPYPYLCPDRLAVHAPFAIMVQNGWRRQNLMGDQHFQEKTGALNDTGRQMVRTIAQDENAQHRMIYVSRAATSEETAARIAAVQKHVAQVAPTNKVPVNETTLRPAGYPVGWPSNKDTSISRKFPISVPSNIYLPKAESSGN